MRFSYETPGVLSRLGLPSVGAHWPIVAALVVDAVGSGLFLPFSVLFFLATTSLSLVEVGLALSLAAALRLPAGPLLGAVTDRVGPSRVLVLANALQAVGLLGYLAVNSFSQLVLAAVVVQVGSSAFWAAYAPLVMQVAAAGQRERWFGLLGAGRNAGFALGGLLAGIAVSGTGTTGYHLVVAVDAASYAAAGCVFLAVRPARPPEPVHTTTGSAWRTVLRDRPYRSLAVVNVAFAMNGEALTFVLPVYAVTQLGLPAWIAGAALSLNCVLVALGQGPVVAALAGRRRVRALQWACGLYVAAAVLMLVGGLVAPAVAVAVVLAGVVVLTAGELIESPVMATVASEAAPDALRGRYLSVHQLSWNVSGIVAPLLFTALLASGGLATWAGVAAVAVAGGVGITAVARQLPAARASVGEVPPVTP